MQKIIRITIYIVVSLILLNSFFFIFLAGYKSVKAYILIAQGKMEERPGMLLAESLDSFLVALFFMIFSIGIAKLFLPASKFLKGYDLPWLKIDNFSQLKYILWEVLLTSLFVFFVTGIVVEAGHLEWIHLVVPVSIVLLALAYKLFKKEH